MNGHTQGWTGALVAGFVAVAAASTFGDEPRSYEGFQIARVDVASEAQLAAIERAGAVVLNCIPGVGPMDVVINDAQRARLEALGLTFDILHENAQALIDAERAEGPRGSPFEDFFLSYHRYDNGFGSIVWYMNELVSRYPTLASIVEVGTTVEGRTIWGLRVTGEAQGTKPAVVYFSCVHAREWVTTTVPTYLATQLLEGYAGDAAIRDLMDRTEFYLIPVVNLDGYAYSWTNNRYWRKNRRDNGPSFGVDLNRNWAKGWGGPGSSDGSGSETYRGTAPFSEPETQALRDFFLGHANVRAQLDIHNYSQLILWPYGYTSELPSAQPTYENIGLAMQALIASIHGRWYDAGPVYTTIYPASGVSVDWTYAVLGLLSYTFECRDRGQYGFNLPASQIIPNNEELLPAILHMSDTDWVHRLPLTSIAVDPNPATCGEVVTFDASGSVTDAGHQIVSYRWDFDGDGDDDLVSSDSVVQWSYGQFGEYTVTLRVTDDDTPAKSDTALFAVSVSLGNTEPVADAGAPIVVAWGQMVPFDASASFDPDEACGDAIASYDWDLDDDGAFDDMHHPSPTVVWWFIEALDIDFEGAANPIHVRVTDSFGLTSVASTTLTIITGAGCVADAQCGDDEPCTVDRCDPADPGADGLGCVHEYRPELFGDVAPMFAWEPGAPEQPDLDDVLCLLDGFGAGPGWAGVCPAGDVRDSGSGACGPDGALNLDDIVSVLDAFGGVAGCPNPCPS